MTAFVSVLVIVLVLAIWWGFASPMPPMPPDVDPPEPDEHEDGFL